VHQTFKPGSHPCWPARGVHRRGGRRPILRLAPDPRREPLRKEQSFILRYFFQANPPGWIGRYSRYEECSTPGWRGIEHRGGPGCSQHGGHPGHIQVLSQLAWIDEESTGPEIRELVARERGYTPDDQALIGAGNWRS